MRTTTVLANDTLSAIAQRVLGNGNRWRDLAEANPHVNPNRLAPGQVLRVPEELAAATPSRTRREGGIR